MNKQQYKGPHGWFSEELFDIPNQPTRKLSINTMKRSSGKISAVARVVTLEHDGFMVYTWGSFNQVIIQEGLGMRATSSNIENVQKRATELVPGILILVDKHYSAKTQS